MAHKRGKRSGEGGRPRSKTRPSARLIGSRGDTLKGGGTGGAGLVSEARGRAAERALRRRGAIPVRRATLLASALGLFLLGLIAGGAATVLMSRAGWPGLPAAEMAALMGQTPTEVPTEAPTGTATLPETPAPDLAALAPTPEPALAPASGQAEEAEAATAEKPAPEAAETPTPATAPAKPEPVVAEATPEPAVPEPSEATPREATPREAASQEAAPREPDPAEPAPVEMAFQVPPQAIPVIPSQEMPAEEASVESAAPQAEESNDLPAPSLFGAAQSDPATAGRRRAPEGRLLLSEILPPLALQGGPRSRPALAEQTAEILAEAASGPEAAAEDPEAEAEDVVRAREPDYAAQVPVPAEQSESVETAESVEEAGSGSEAPAELAVAALPRPALVTDPEAEPAVISSERLPEPEPSPLMAETAPQPSPDSLAPAAGEAVPLSETRAEALAEATRVETVVLADATLLPTPAAYHPGGLPPWEENAITIAPGGQAPMIALVIDDLGLNRPNTRRTIDLPAPLTLAFLTYAVDLENMTAKAHKRGHELIVHVPMEPLDPKENPGDKPLTTGLPLETLQKRLTWALSRFDGYVGINNHMGSKFTSWPAGMELVMGEMQRRGLLFLDSVTSQMSVSGQTAQQFEVPFARRDIFLDNEYQNRGAIARQLAQLESLAKRRGYAVGIGHPHTTTLDVLTQWIPDARARGFRLVPISAVVRHRIEVAGSSGQRG